MTALQKIIGRTKHGPIHGGMFPGPARYQDMAYAARVAKLMNDRKPKREVVDSKQPDHN